MPMLSEEGRQWMSSRTGEDVSFERFRPVATQNAWMNVPGFISDNGELPDRAITEMALEGYLNAACRLIFPMVDGVLFKDVIDDAYDESEGPIPMSRLTAKSCVLAFLSIAFLFRTSTSPMPDMDSDTFAMRAHYYLPDIMEDNTLVGLQTTFMLNLYQASTGRLQAAAMLHAVACRSVFMLGGHAYRPIKPYTADIGRQERESRQLRLLFWLCYIFDKDISLRMNQPPLMSEEYCDMTLPEGYVNSHLFLPDTDTSLSTRLDFDKHPFPLFPGELRLCRFKDKTARLLYSAQAVNKTEAELFQNIRELDDELEQWRLSIIPEYRPNLSINELAEECIMKQIPGPLTGMRRIVLHLEYHHLMTTIHRASGRCSIPSAKGNTENPGFVPGGLTSSIDLTIEASRSTLVFLRTATRHLEAAAFWSMVFYPTAAIMAIFLNVLQYPLAPTAESDLKLLGSAATTIRAMPLARLSHRELAHLDMMDDFVAELVHLGNRAIQMELTRKQQVHGCMGR
ncbi:hypothetical protein F5X68DRAFT_244065 [Plectosphaerella plurivora]|uniref:Xylanolytic transcriptional activator regulatory domain-containing protein n=1 Tax=Plectosphaerella plurivora TaxID=936078 RepID=A0A9P8VKZ2_9PEZI|nr:hypothetical protein F5X68DRAFT_244065 [Plectosphaerella plurivora]